MIVVRRPVLAAAIVCLSLGAGLLSLVALRWIGFLGLPPVFFLTLLMVGMPVGGLLLASIRRLKELSLSSMALVSGGMAVASAALFLVALQWTNAYIEMGTEFSVLISTLLLRFLVAAAAFFPLFVGYGLVELAVYRAGLSGLKGNSALVYALNLSGLLLAFLGYRVLLVPLGTTGLLATGLAMMGLSAFVLAPRRWPLLVATLFLACLVFVPGLESWAISALEVKKGDSTLNYWRVGNRVLYDRWTPHCRLTIVDTGRGIYGFYDGMYYWVYRRGMPDPRARPGSYRRPEVAFSMLVKSGDRVAVLGSGGGLQVGAALRAGAGRVWAVEVVPEVLEVLSGPLSRSVEGIYADSRVQLVPKNARRFLQESDEQFDVIVVASVESILGGMRELFEPSQVMFTREAFAQMKSHLAPGGVLCISKFTAVDRRGVVFKQTFEQLRRLDLRTRGYVQLRRRTFEAAGDSESLFANAVHYLIVAQKGRGELDALATMDNVFRGTNVRAVTDPPTASDLPQITDDRAFATGLLVANLGKSALAWGIGLVAGALLVVGLILAWTLRRTLRHSKGGPSPRGLSSAAVLVGFNFLVLEYLMVYRWMDKLDVPMDATFMGMVVFAFLAAVGSVLLAGRSSRFLVAGAGITAAALLVSGFLLPEANMAALAAAALLTGSLFPRILKGPDRDLVRVYVWDAYGTLWGAVAAVCVPLFTGFSGHQALSGLALLLAVYSVHRAAQPRYS